MYQEQHDLNAPEGNEAWNDHHNKVLEGIKKRQEEEAMKKWLNQKQSSMLQQYLLQVEPERRHAIPEIPGIKGVGKDAEVETLPNGAKHSRLDRAFHLLPALALSKIAEILHEGADKYEPVELLNSVRANWRGIPTHSHVNHALQHLVAYLAEDTQDDHLGHATARLMFALELREGKA